MLERESKMQWYSVICMYCMLVEDHTDDVLASYAVAASGFPPPFAKANKRKFSVNIDEKLAAIFFVAQVLNISNSKNLKLLWKQMLQGCKCNTI